MLQAIQNLRSRIPFLGGRTGDSARKSDPNAKASRRSKVHAKIDLRNAGPEKKVFLEGLAQLIDAGRPEAEVYTRVENYFYRHGTGEQLTDWEWDMISICHPQDNEETIRSIIRRSMTEAAIRIVSVVLHGELPGKEKLPLRAQLERAEWSSKRGGQTLFLTMDEATAGNQIPGDQEALPEPLARTA